jgi:hypothetical protein
MLNRNGAYSFAGRDLNLNQSETSKAAFASDSISNDIEPDIQGLEAAYLNIASAINWKNKIWVTCTAASGTSNDTMFVFDYARVSNSDRKQGAWSKFDQHHISKMTIHEGLLLGGGSASGGDSTKGYVFQLDNGFTDNGSTISASYETAAIRGNKGHEQSMKDWRWAYITVDVINSSHAIKVSHSVDFSDFVNDVTYDLSASLTETVKIIKHPIALGASESSGDTVRASGRFIRLRITNEMLSPPSTASVTVRKIEVFYTLRGLR